ncbi:MAG TPA: PVC-type heme-binding CxxCH protein, partial [Verrucomicrobiae bacterium]|nr:PVC-type heme-binding CxxCH protein [Verrucomicrobiae bacterium]
TNYAGAKTDRIKVFPGSYTGGKPDKMTIFAEGFRHAMNLAFAPDGRLFLVHRNGVMILEDKDGDGVCDSRATIVQLETKGDYPHNGIGGIVFSSDGWIYLGSGENLGMDYVIKGSDGSQHAGGEGGNIYRCRLDGSHLELFTTGCWNVFAFAFTSDGHLVCVDNDPDSSPPCRLLDIVPRGDYGFKFRFGRNGLHPYQSWNGDMPGTLPMISGTGEAPSGVLNCDKARLPAHYRGGLLVTSWGDHYLEFYAPVRHGASLRADREIIAEGDENFRPVAITTTPDGVIYLTDWVDKSYPVHGKGRLWRLAAKADSKAGIAASHPATSKPNPARDRMFQLLDDSSLSDAPALLAALTDKDPFIRSAAIASLAKPIFRDRALVEIGNTDARVRVGALLALRRANYDQPAAILRKTLGDPDEAVRRISLVWAGEAVVKEVAGMLDAALSAGPFSSQLFQTHAATKKILAQDGNAAGSPALVNDGKVRIFAMQAATPRDTARAVQMLEQPEKLPDTLVREATRTLAEEPVETGARALASFAANTKRPTELRAEALLALASQPNAPKAKLIERLFDGDDAVKLEAARALRVFTDDPAVKAALQKANQLAARDSRLAEELRFALAAAGGTTTETRPANLAEWMKALETRGDVASGRRVFYSAAAGCSRCHRVEGHGGQIGPDLSVIARAAKREKIAQSILDPSREIAPQFVTHIVETRDGQSYSGLLIGDSTDGSVTLTTTDGKGVLIPGSQVASRQQSKVSLMPEGLEKGMSIGDFRDLLAFLETLN